MLSKALRIIRDAYGEAGLDGPVIDGIGLLCQRYDGQLAEQRAIDRPAAAHGGVSGCVVSLTNDGTIARQPYTLVVS